MPVNDVLALLIQLSVAAFLGATARNWWQVLAVVAGLFVAGLLYDFTSGPIHSDADRFSVAITLLAAAGLGHILRRIIIQ
jgi:hypothetical protein